MRRKEMIFAAVMGLCPCLLAQSSEWPPSPDRLTIRIWPGVPPGPAAPADPFPEGDTTLFSDVVIADKPVYRLGDVATPTLTLYKAKGTAPAPAVLVFPGGGYRILNIDLEGTEACDWFNSVGVTCVLLKYRVPGTGPYPKSVAALQDAQRAMGLVRLHATEWGIDPKYIGALGFSAGGHLTAAISNLCNKRFYAPVDEADKLSCRPDFAVVVYPGYLAINERNFAPNPEIHPSAETPPTFIIQAENDPQEVENAVVYFMQLRKANVPAELHIYAEGGHGFGMRPNFLPATYWPQLLETWLRTVLVLPAK